MSFLFKDKNKESKESKDEKKDKKDKNENKEEQNEEENKEKTKEETKKVEEVEEGKFIEMKKGDYQVHVLIEEIKDAKCSTLEGSAKDLAEGTEARPPVPMVKITCLGTSKRTKKPEGPVKNYVYDEHFYFDGLNMTKEMLDSEKILLEIYDNQNIKRECYLGVQEFDFSFIYSKEGHVLRNFWMALANPYGSDITAVKGYLKISISVLHENDERKELVMKDADSSECFTPTQVKIHYKQICLNIFKAEGIPDMDDTNVLGIGKEKSGTKASCNGVVFVSFGAVEQCTTDVQMVNKIIKWDQVIKIPVSEPCVSQKLKIVVKDKDSETSFDIVGSIELLIDDVREGVYKNPQFLDIYGSYLNKKDERNTLMNMNSEIGSRWKGRILISIDYIDIDKPLFIVEKITNKELVDKAYKTGRNYSWKLLFGIYDTVFLPEDSGKYKLEICWGDKTIPIRDEKTAVNGSIYWGYSGSAIMQTSTANLAESPDIFIYLIKKDSRICVQRLECRDVYLNTSDMAVKLIPEYGNPVVKSLMESGIINCKMGVFRNDKEKPDPYNEKDFQVEPPEEKKALTKSSTNIDDAINLLNDDDDEEEDTKKAKEPEPVSNVNKKDYKVVVVVYMTKGMNPAEKKGSNPYVVIKLGNTEQKTEVKTNTINGVWMQGLEFITNFDINKKSTYPAMMLRVKHKTNVFSSNKVLNYTYIWLSKTKARTDLKEMADPRWYKLYTPKSNQQIGQILLSFYIFSDLNTKLSDIKIIPDTVPYTFEINLLGLRELQPLSLLPVKKPYIKFDINGLNFTGFKDDSLKEIQTTPGDPGCNPTINTIFKFDVNLPVNERYIPDLQCEVYDYVLSGMFKSLLGVFTLNVKRLAKKTQLRFNEDLANIKNATLKKIGGMIIGKTFTDLQSFAFRGIQEENKKEEDISTTNSRRDESLINDDKKDNNLKEELLDRKENSDAVLKISNKNTKGSKNNDNSIEIQNIHTCTLEQINGVILPRTLPNEMKDDPKYFVRYPYFKEFKIPGSEVNSDNNNDFWIEDTQKKPDESQFMEVGYLLKIDPHSEREKSTKHYRRIYGQPLETVKELNIKKPFLEAYLKRGKTEEIKDDKIIFELMSNPKKKILIHYENEKKEKEEEEKLRIEENKKDEESQSSSLVEASSSISVKEYNANKSEKEETYGKFKGIIRIAKKEQFDKYEQEVKKYANNPKYTTILKYMKKHEEICKKILIKTKIIVRLYVLKLRGLAPRDINGLSDPFIKIYIGDKLFINESDNHHNEELNTDWCKYYDIPCTMPGSGSLRLEVWDYDHLLSDDLIGTTTIDLEDRYYCQNWQNLSEKPIEVRPLFHPDEQCKQGDAYIWLEMFNEEERTQRIPRCIELEPIIKYEVRFIVWTADDIEMMDPTDTSDPYVIAFFDRKEKKSTDVHYFVQSGKPACWNWRLLLPFQTPAKSTILNIQMFDKDLFGSDDYLTGQELNIGDIIQMPRLLDVPFKFTRKYYNQLSLEERQKFCKRPIEFESEADDKEGVKFTIQCQKEDAPKGTLVCSLEILPEWKAKLNPVGNGRDEPNIDPYLPPPVGRFEWSLNPFKLIDQCVGKKFKRKCYCIICAVLCTIYLCVFIPYLIYHLSAELVNPFK